MAIIYLTKNHVLGIVFDFFVLLMGIGGVVWITLWAAKKGWVHEKYCIALLAFVAFAMYAIVNYDPNKGKCDCPPPTITPCVKEHSNHSEVDSQQNSEK